MQAQLIFTTREVEIITFVMTQALLVGLGGFLGSIFRYQLGGWISQQTPSWRFPFSTFVINVLGCVAIGILAGLIERRDWFSADTRLFLLTGLLGGFTTFSTYGLEGVQLMRRGEPGMGLLYTGASVVVGFGAVWLTMRLINPINV